MKSKNLHRAKWRFLGNTAQFPPNGLAAAAPRSPYRHLELCGIALSFLSTEITGGFTGCTVGMYASANGIAGTNHAAFYWFAYQQVRNKLRKNMTIKSSSRRRGAAFGL